MRKLPIQLKITFVIIYILTAASLFISIKYNYIEINYNYRYYDILVFMVIISLSESFGVWNKKITLSTSFAVYLLIFIVFGPFFTIVTFILGFSFRVLKNEGKSKHIFNTPFYGTLFNYCCFVLPVVIGNYIHRVFSGKNVINNNSDSVISLILFCLMFFLVNTLIISIFISVQTSQNLLFIYINNLRIAFLNNIIMAPFGFLLAHMFSEYGYVGLFWILFPVVLARYTFILYVNVRSQYLETIDSLMKAIEARDQYTEGHSQRVGDIAIKIAKELKYNDFQIEHLKIASLFHDVGKIGVEDSILNKPGMLSKEEFCKIKVHPKKGYEILKGVKNLEKILPIVLHHHERYDGKGYPEGKLAEELSIDVFIVQLADAVDAMATDRPYRVALSKERIIYEIQENSGTQFHPKVVEAYLNVLEREKKIG